MVSELLHGTWEFKFGEHMTNAIWKSSGLRNFTSVHRAARIVHCIYSPSRIPRRECHSRQHWAFRRWPQRLHTSIHRDRDYLHVTATQHPPAE